MSVLAGGVALVTGAGSGIGAAVARQLAAQGMKVMACDMDLLKMKQVQSEIENNEDVKSKGGLYFPIHCDLTKEDDILTLFRTIKEKYTEGLNVCVNCAGVGHKASIMEGETHQWRHMLDINVLAYAICAREAIKQMQQNGVDGHIVNVCSMSGQRIRPSRPDFSFYNMTKYAVTALTESLKHELKDKNIRVSQICPGVVETEFTDSMYAGHPDDQKAVADLYQSRKVLQAQDVAEAVSFILTRPSHVQIQDIWMMDTGY